MVSYFDYSSDKSRFPKVDDTRRLCPRNRLVKYRLKVDRNRGRLRWPCSSKNLGRINTESSTRVFELPFQLPSDISLNDFSPKLAMLIETTKYPDDKHFVYSAFHEDGDMVDTGPRNFESIDYVGWIRRLWCWRTVVRRSAAIISVVTK
jgi:hypothetical protein